MGKKITLSIAAGFAAVTLLSACSSGSEKPAANSGSSASSEGQSKPAAAGADNSKPVTLKFASWSAGEDATKDALQTMANKYHEKHPNVTVEFQVVPFNNIKEQTFVWAASGEAPDVIQTFSAWFPSYAASDIVEPLDNLMGKDYIDDLIPSLKEDYMYNGKLMGVPWAVSPYILYWNKELFQKAGLEQRPPKTYDEMLDMAKKLSQLKTDKGEQVYGLGEATDKLPINGEIALRNIYSFKGSIFDASGKVNVNTPEVKDALTFYQNLAKQGLSPQSAKLKDLRNLFSIGRLGMYVDGYYGKNVFRSLSGKGESYDKVWEAALIPANKTGDSISINEAHGLVISKDSKNKEVAADFIKFLTGPEMMTYYHQQDDVLSASKTISKLPAFTTSAFDKVLVDQVNKAHSLPKNNPGLEQAYLEIADTVQRVTLGNQDPATAAEALNTKLQGLMK
jgi:multiple sugar transport system substrate-binding protein